MDHAAQVIGMGKYQSALFALAGHGWMCDQVSNPNPAHSMNWF